MSTTVVRIRLPRDRSFIYLRVSGWSLDARLIRRRYWSKKRIEVMRFREPVSS